MGKRSENYLIKNESVEIEAAPTDALALKLDAEDVYVTFRTDMSAVCSVHATRFEELVDTNADTAGLDVEEQVQMVVINPP